VFARCSASRFAGRPEVVLVHGLVVSSRYLVPTARLLADHCNVAMPDLPGWGRSGAAGRALSIPELADVLAEWMRVTGRRRAVLLGNSMGCQIIVDVAARYPQLVAGLVLVGPTVQPEGRNPVVSALRQLRLMFRESPWLAGIIALDLLDMGPGRAARMSYICLRDPVEQKLPAVIARALVVHGEHDLHVPQRWADEVVRLLPRGRAECVPGAAHAINYSRPEVLAERALPFIRRCWAGG
jgi:2-hydroxy-6-oxonona-2,4-dienedioate hydrolase